MKFKQVINFAKNANYGENVLVFLGYEILEYLYDEGYIIGGGQEIIDDLEAYDEDDEYWCAAIPLLNNETKELIKFIICVGKKFHKLHKNKDDMYKFVMLHEIGHINTYHDKVFDSEENLAKYELESQLWAIKRAKEMGLKRVGRRAWENLQDWDKQDKVYQLAKKMYDDLKK